MENKFFISYTINDHIEQILGQGGELAYLVKGKNRAVLIDGLEGAGSLKAFVRELTDLPVTLILTHGHLDHIGAAFEYRECMIHPDDMELFYDERHFSKEARLGFAKVPSPLASHQLPSLSIDDVVEGCTVRMKPLYDGDVLELGGIELEAIGVPGHTWGTLVFLDRKDRILFSGDAVNINTLLGMKGSASVEDYLESLRHLKNFDDAYDVMYGGHGTGCVMRSIVDDAIAMCERIIARTDEKIPSFSLDHEPVYYASDHNPDYSPKCGGLANIQYKEEEILKGTAKKCRSL